MLVLPLSPPRSPREHPPPLRLPKPGPPPRQDISLDSGEPGGCGPLASPGGPRSHDSY